MKDLVLDRIMRTRSNEVLLLLVTSGFRESVESVDSVLSVPICFCQTNKEKGKKKKFGFSFLSSGSLAVGRSRRRRRRRRRRRSRRRRRRCRRRWRRRRCSKWSSQPGAETSVWPLRWRLVRFPASG